MSNLFQLNHRDPDYESRNIPLVIYGTLMTGQSNHRVMEDLVKFDHARLMDRECVLPDTCIVRMGGLPSLYSTGLGSASNTVAELWHTSSTALDILDIFEGNPTFYYRTDMRALSSDGRACVAIVYRGPSLEIESVQVIAALDPDEAIYISSWAAREDTGTITADMNTAASVIMPRPPNAEEPLIETRLMSRGINYRGLTEAFINPPVLPGADDGDGVDVDVEIEGEYVEDE